jgi:hypothetical protein
MNIQIKPSVSPLTGGRGFLAYCSTDSAFAFSKEEAKQKLASRLLEKCNAIFDEETGAFFKRRQ